MNWTITSSSIPDIVFNPVGFRQTVNLLQIKKDEAAFKRVCEDIKKRHAELDAHLDFLARANNVMTQEIRNSLKALDPYENTEAVESDVEKMHLASDNQFLRVTFRCLGVLRGLFEGFRALVSTLDPQGLYIPKEGLDGLDDSLEGVQKMHAIVQLNGRALERYVGALFGIDATKKHILDYAYEIVQVLDGYHRALVKRHSTDGLEIHGNPVLTDVAMSIFENVDAHGEIEAGDDPNRVSAYTRRKAQILARAVDDEPLRGFIRKLGSFLEYLKSALRSAWHWGDTLKMIFAKHVNAALDRWERPYVRLPSKAEFDSAVQHISDLDPNLVKYKDRAVMLTADERMHHQFVNQTLAKMVEIMSGDEDGVHEKLIKYVLERRAEMARRSRDENTFYVCKIGEGNRFKQIPPGMLTVVPGERPNVSIDEIWGSGFDDIRDHIDSIEMGAKWHDLFVATSPSRSADKSNVLMIGPQGCGKSQVLRAVGADRGSVAVFAQGSDFLTCWLGEAEKNPKRMFEGAARLQKETGKHVYILIDEADSVMKKQEEKRHGEVDLTLEFQICMDGVVHYPKITVVAATNSPARMPMTMIRRFSKVLIVGELDQEARKKILRHYAGFMPLKGFSDRHWDHAALRLEGATGDVIRKVVDHVWRQKMTWFVKHQAERADEMLKWLSADVRFDIAEFAQARREEFKRLLGPHVHIEPVDVERSVDLHLKNVGIQGEIRTAKAVYKEAHELLDSLDSSGLIVAS